MKPSNDSKSPIVPGILSINALCFLLFLYAPLEVFSQNINDFSYDIYDLMKAMIPFWVAFAVAFSLLLLVVRKFSTKASNCLSLICFAVLISAFIQGTFLSSNLPSLDGGNVDWALYDYQRIPSVIVWALPAVLICFLVWRVGVQRILPAAKTVSILFIAFLVVSSVLVCLSGDTMRNRTDAIVTTDCIEDFSNDENFIILMLDMTDADGFNDYLTSHPEYKDIFKDFTFYRNAMAGYPFTACSIPLIFSGEWFEYQRDYEDYLSSAYEDSAFFAALSEEEYRLGLYEAEFAPLSDKGRALFENIYEPAGTGLNNPVNYIKMQLCFAGLKYSPYDLKRFCVLTPENIYWNSLKDFSGTEVFTTDNRKYYLSLTEKAFNITGEKCFRFIHINGVHPPYYYDVNLNRIENGTYSDSMASCFTITEAFLNKIRDAGIYDNSVIVIMADHGGYDCRTNPILFIKGRNETHDYAESYAPVAYEDLQAAFVSLLNGETGEKVFSYREGDARERRFLNYQVLGDDPFTEYIEYGAANDSDNLIPTGRLFAKATTE